MLASKGRHERWGGEVKAHRNAQNLLCFVTLHRKRDDVVSLHIHNDVLDVGHKLFAIFD